MRTILHFLELLNFLKELENKTSVIWSKGQRPTEYTPATRYEPMVIEISANGFMKYGSYEEDKKSGEQFFYFDPKELINRAAEHFPPKVPAPAEPKPEPTEKDAIKNTIKINKRKIDKDEEKIRQQTNKYTKYHQLNYSFKPAPCYVKNAGEIIKYTTFFGVEIEKNGNGDDNLYQLATAIYDHLNRPSLFYHKYDGSLNNRGNETVSHPVSLASWMHPETQADLKNLFDLFPQYGYTSGSNTGLHIHFTKNDTSVKKLKIINELFYVFWRNNRQGLCNILKRNSERATYWQPRGTLGDRYNIINMTSKTIEIRAYGSPKTYERFNYCLLTTAAVKVLTDVNNNLLDRYFDPDKFKETEKIMTFIFKTFPEILSEAHDVSIIKPKNLDESLELAS